MSTHKRLVPAPTDPGQTSPNTSTLPVLSVLNQPSKRLIPAPTDPQRQGNPPTGTPSIEEGTSAPPGRIPLAAPPNEALSPKTLEEETKVFENQDFCLYLQKTSHGRQKVSIIT
jgi:hypothetical protein